MVVSLVSIGLSFEVSIPSSNYLLTFLCVVIESFTFSGFKAKVALLIKKILCMSLSPEPIDNVHFGLRYTTQSLKVRTTYYSGRVSYLKANNSETKIIIQQYAMVATQ